MSKGVDFQDRGIAEAINQNRLVVPVNQRSYKWEAEHVTDLLADLENAIANTDSEYFLGTMVFTRKSANELEVADGQQRLATIVMLLAAFRDFLHSDPSQNMLEASIREKYLASFDEDTDGIRPQLTLNTEDNDFFHKRILANPDDPQRLNNVVGAKLSHARIHTAANIVRNWVQKIVATPNAANPITPIKSWIKYLRNSVRVILVIVPDPGKAFRIFETLNDRGLKLSQVDLLKNHLYSLADTGRRLSEAQQRWDEMVGALEASGYEDLSLDYIRQLWISSHGHIKEAELYNAIKDHAKAPGSAIEFACDLAVNAIPFTALLNPSHPLWDQHTNGTTRCVAVMKDSLRVDRIRPLMLSIMAAFSKKDTERAFRLCVSWTVRFLIVGGIGSGTVEQFYADAAKKVRNGEIPTPEALASEMQKHVPADDKFQEEFTRASVSRTYLARYYLRVLERQSCDPSARDAALAADDESARVTLEHVIPQRPSAHWPMEDELRASLVGRIGNLALLEKKPNSTIRDDGFLQKALAYKDSAFLLTKRIAKQTKWGPKQINQRQIELARLAVKAWPISV